MKIKGLVLRLKNKVRKWLGFGEMFIGVDVGIKDESCVVIASKLNNGQVRIIDVRFGSHRELQLFIKQTQWRYGIVDKDVICDMPMGCKPLI